MQVTVIHKTMMEALEKCDRFFWLKYCWGEIGLDTIKAPHLAQGSAVHKGVEIMFTTGDIDQAVAGALEEFMLEWDPTFFQDPLKAAAWYQEYRASIEAAVTVFCLHVYPRVLSRYSHVQAEYKVETRLTKDLTLYARPDEIIQSDFDGRFFNLSLKTEKQHSSIKHSQAQIDLGGLTEGISLANTLGEGNLSEIGGTIMLYLVMGNTAEDDDGSPIVWHPGVHGWRRPKGGVTNEYDYAWRWKYDNPDYDPNGPVGRKNTKTKSLSVKDGWERFSAQDYPGGIRQWVADLLAGEFHPRGVDPLKELVFMPEPYVRNPSKVESFLTQTVSKFEEVNDKLANLAAGTKNLDQTFQQRRTSCLRYGLQWKCEMFEFCWGDAARDPLAHGLVVRKPRDQREAEKDAKRAKIAKEKS